MAVKKLKIYLDTSVISHLQHEDVPEKMKETLLFWEELKTGKYDVVTSDLRACFKSFQAYTRRRSIRLIIARRIMSSLEDG
jgi:predicted nucleic acid-binding protein